MSAAAGAGAAGAGAGVCPSAATHDYVPNRLGNVIAMVDAAGAVTDRYVYTPGGLPRT